MQDPPQAPGDLFRAYEERTKKRFGQHFLVDPGILEEIVSFADLSLDEPVLEIGPGCGTLSLVLIQQGAKVFAVEKDRDAVAFLKKAMEPHYPFVVRSGDALRLDLGEILDQEPGEWKVVANLPYNVSTEILFRLFEQGERIRSMVLMFQREVARRIVAKAGDDGYGALSLMAQLHAEAELVMTLKPGAFVPPPKVHSAVVEFRPIPGTRIPDARLRDAFRRVVRAGFQARRKTLANGLKQMGCEKGAVEEVLDELGLRAKVRPERVEFQSFLELTEALLEREIMA